MSKFKIEAIVTQEELPELVNLLQAAEGLMITGLEASTKPKVIRTSEGRLSKEEALRRLTTQHSAILAVEALLKGYTSRAKVRIGFEAFKKIMTDGGYKPGTASNLMSLLRRTEIGQSAGRGRIEINLEALRDLHWPHRTPVASPVKENANDND